MTTEYVCIDDMVCTGQIYRPIKTNQKSKISAKDGLKRLATTIGDYAIELYRYSKNLEPVFSNGGTRVLIRPDRIDLV